MVTEEQESITRLQQENEQLRKQVSEMFASSIDIMKSKSELESILHNAGEGVIIFNSDGTVKSLNRTAEKIFGYSEVALMNQHVPFLFNVPIEYEKKVPLFLKHFLEQYPQPEEHPLYGVDVNGNKIPLALAISEVAPEQMLFFDDFSDVQAQEEKQEEDTFRHDYELFAAIVRDISSEIASKNKLAEQNRQLEQVYLKLSQNDRIQSEFLAKISHELLTPLNGILGMANILLEEVPSEQREMVQVIQDSANRLNGIIHNILNFDQHRADEEDVKHYFDLCEVIDQILERKNKQIQMKQLAVFFNRDENMTECRLFGMENRFYTMLDNLVDNAIKFTPQGKIVIDVRLSRKDPDQEYVEIIVSDTGIGIDAANFEKIFQPFTQLEDTVTREYGGVGMGLTIVRQIIQGMDGAIEVDSTPGKGSRFMLSIPVTSPEQKTTAIL